VSNFVTLLPKLPNEKVPRTVDFISKLPSGITIASAATTATVYSGNDSSPSSILSGSPTISGTKVTQVLQAGVSGCIYQIAFGIVGSDGNDYQLQGYFAVTPGLP